jgi:hypothetical protein
MTHVFERIPLACSYATARACLRKHVEAAMQRGAPLVVRFTVNAVGARLQKNVLLLYAPGVDPLRVNEVWNVRWTPEGGGPYPDFTGELTVRQDGAKGPFLELEGSYEPPLGYAGAAFDMLAGSRIAAATAQAVLRLIVDEMTGAP